MEGGEDVKLRKAFGYEVCRARSEKSMTQERLAELTGLSVREISNIENGLVEPQFGNAVIICSVCDIDIKKFYPIVENEKELVK